MPQSPPSSIESERAILGACFLRPEIIPQVRAVIQPRDFYREAHGLIFEAMCSLGKSSEPASVAEWLSSKGWLERAGGQPALMDLWDCVSTSAGWLFHAGVLKEKATRREIIQACSVAMDQAYGIDETPEILEQLESNLQGIEQGTKDKMLPGVHLGNVYTPERMLSEYEAYIERLQHNRFITGIGEIDRRIRGVSGGEVLYIIARAGSFKTAILQNLLRRYVQNSAWGAAFFSLEMPIAGLTERFHGIINREPGRDVERAYQDPQGNTDEHRLHFLKELKNLFTVPTRVSTADIASYVRLIEKYHKIKVGLIGIDYLGLMDTEGRGEYEMVTKLARDTKNLAKSLNLPIVVLSQTSRKGGSGETEIALDMGRGSGAIEEAADFVLGTFRADDGVIIKILKNRKGRIGTCWKVDLDQNTLFLGTEAFEWTPPKEEKKGHSFHE